MKLTYFSTFFLSETHLDSLLDGLCAVSAVNETHPVVSVGDAVSLDNFDFLFRPEMRTGSGGRLERESNKSFVHLG